VNEQEVFPTVLPEDDGAWTAKNYIEWEKSVRGLPTDSLLSAVQLRGSSSDNNTHVPTTYGIDRSKCVADSGTVGKSHSVGEVTFKADVASTGDGILKNKTVTLSVNGEKVIAEETGAQLPVMNPLPCGLSSRRDVTSVQSVSEAAQAPEYPLFHYKVCRHRRQKLTAHRQDSAKHHGTFLYPINLCRNSAGIPIISL
jgi:hypothetical protein